MLTKYCVCDVGYPPVVQMLLFTKIYQHFKSTWSCSFSINMHPQKHWNRKVFAKNVLRRKFLILDSYKS